MQDIDKIIIFPDIHGRTFWRPIARKYLGKPGYGFVFLGDYFDPYAFENISEYDALLNFRDMWAMFSNFNDKVVWLLGNHDLHYLSWLSREYGVRRSFEYFENISNIFTNNLDKFKIAYETYDANGRKILFTHAGVVSSWTEQFDNPKLCYDADFLNSLLYDKDLRWSLWDISFERGGNEPTGSPVWADHYEMSWTEYPENIYQVFGHTLSVPDLDTPIITDKYAMLDARKPFILDLNTGKIDTII